MAIDSKQDSEMKIWPKETVTEAFSSSVTVEKCNDPNLIHCRIGNSGLLMRFYNNDRNSKITFDYYPFGEGKENVIKNDAIKVVMFSSALLSFRNWLNDPYNEKEYEFSRKNLSEIANYTNSRMANFIKKLFSENGHSKLVTIDDNDRGFYTSINVQKFCNLSKKDKLIKHLQKLDERAKGLVITYNKTIHRR